MIATQPVTGCRIVTKDRSDHEVGLAVAAMLPRSQAERQRWEDRFRAGDIVAWLIASQLQRRRAES